MIPPAIPDQVWERHPPTRQPTRPPIPLGNAGGVSGSDLWRVETLDGPLMLRAWPIDGPARERINQIHRWLVPLRRFAWVAAPLANLQGETVRDLAGRAWEITAFLPGRADLDQPPTRSHLALMFENLARVHLQLDPVPERGASPGLLARHEELTRLTRGEFAQLATAIRAAPLDEIRWLADRWLERATETAPAIRARLELATRASFDLQVVLRDVRPDHFLFEGDRLTGLVDFGAMGVDTIATDLARLLGETVGSSVEQRQVALAAYEILRPIAEAERAALGDFEAANAALGGTRWVRWHFVERRAFADPRAVAGGLRRALLKLGVGERWPR